MKVILQQDVKDIGKVGELLNVKEGFARNFLFPRKLAVEATETRIKEWEHLKRVTEVKKKKALEEKKAVLNKMSGVALTFKMQAGEGEKLFGTVTSTDIAKELAKKGFAVDRRDIHLEEAIKLLGTHKATIRLSEGLETSIQVIVERA